MPGKTIVGIDYRAEIDKEERALVPYSTAPDRFQICFRDFKFSNSQATGRNSLQL